MPAAVHDGSGRQTQLDRDWLGKICINFAQIPGGFRFNLVSILVFISTNGIFQQSNNKMRPLTEEESKAVFTKLANYIVSPNNHLLSFDYSFSPRAKIWFTSLTDQMNHIVSVSTKTEFSMFLNPLCVLVSLLLDRISSVWVHASGSSQKVASSSSISPRSTTLHNTPNIRYPINFKYCNCSEV